MYEYADKVILFMRKRYIEIFNKYRSSLKIDELNVLNGSAKMYEELERVAEKGLLKIARRYYRGFGGKKNDIDRDWLLDFLEDYEPTVKYVYLHEVDRKRARFAEELIATANKSEAFRTAMRYWNDMVTQFAILTADKAALTAFKDSGVKKVKWYTVPDERRCDTCGELHGKVFSIDKVPPKPHWRCRCYLIPVRGTADDRDNKK